MSRKAAEVVRLLETLKRMVDAETEAAKENTRAPAVGGSGGAGEDPYRPPKRPWEEVDSPGETVGQREGMGPGQREGAGSRPGTGQGATTAEQDMEIIRSKRASTAASSGQPKSKYRKRSRASPPGKCHSCNSRETPEWRRGPDGARTLCNACGLHYAKLVRKRDKLIAEGQTPPVDLAMLRASTAARAAENGGASGSGNRDEDLDTDASPRRSSSPAYAGQDHQGLSHGQGQGQVPSHQQQHPSTAYSSSGPSSSKMSPPSSASASAAGYYAGPMSGTYHSLQQPPPAQYQSMPPPPPPSSSNSHRGPSHVPGHHQHQHQGHGQHGQASGGAPPPQMPLQPGNPPPPPWASHSAGGGPPHGRGSYGSLGDSREGESGYGGGGDGWRARLLDAGGSGGRSPPR
ncbi:hypothetical protein PUNSTDRAFT_113301 [Punctularia strigosozonata HHB-11173 SS5]|uniref:uncharacterized protein n=1 Tax=Punctularia strigosozonata (strain HHB-11173) TaxID=741275 RepID=UPI0004417240|nr:uncharacterized protein PUNSTDRAFT_113301 [Punctularia strigosozonata HHB-11173 SS5]EIN10029.1 hypothetical protein PUNSTDRAFT_113301 [Punctularia strigosozonata HHB-11173 SS5]